MKIRRMQHSDIEFAFQCTNTEGWLGETRETFRAFLDYKADSGFIAEKDGQSIGICIATRYNRNGFIGELIIIKEMRGKGYGRQLFEHSIKYLQSQNIQSIFLDGDLDAVGLYEKCGFRKLCKSLRFKGKLAGEKDDQVQKATIKDMNSICKIDHELFGDDRSFFLKRRFALFPKLFQVLKFENKIYGYISAQPGNGVVSVGPWAVLDETVTPLTLLKSLALEINDTLLRIGILENNSKAVETMKSIESFEETEYCWRMALGPSDELGMSEHLYAIGSAAKG